MKSPTDALKVLALTLSDRLLMSLHCSNSGRRRRQHQITMTLVVAVQDYLNHRMVLANGLHSRMAELGVGNAQDQLVVEMLITVENILAIC
jgi:hypothetical protein